MYTLRN